MCGKLHSLEETAPPIAPYSLDRKPSRARNVLEDQEVFSFLCKEYSHVSPEVTITEVMLKNN
jgi:hypothetical protein